MDGTRRMLPQSILENFPFELNPTLYLSLSLFIIPILVLKLTRTRRNKLNLPPSPPGFPFIGNLHQIGTLPHRSLKALSQKYGPLMFLHLGQKPTLVVSSAHMAREITKSHDVVFSDRPQTTAAKIILYGCKDLGFLPYGEEWRLKRKICVLELLSPKRVQFFQFVVREEVADMISKIREACADGDNKGSCVNMSDMIVAAANNIVCKCLLGQKFQSADGKRSFGDLAAQISAHTIAFSFGDFFPSLRWMDAVTGLISRMNATFREVDAFFDEVIDQHKAARRNEDEDGKSEKKDFVDILQQLQQDGQLDFELTQFDLKATIVDLFLGGSDPTATALEWAFAELVKNPRIMMKAQEEVRRVVGNKPKVEDSDVGQMKYLECVLKETLRLHPPVPLLIPRATRSSVTLGGYHIPAKTSVFVNAWAIQRDPEFWERPEEFAPERFENDQVDFRGQDFQFIPFGSGRRGCPGVSFGFASLEYLLANLLYWFDWKLPETCKSAGDMDMSEAYGITCRKKVPICVQPMLYSIRSKF
ncbi:cytochrome P450 71A1-like [Neltuma alba]|uniref:cytochrome P450 71A1-like n=1 Tax=Neltuma alba TaxID=207710 RepID=UPI0010A41F3A|nr:cytochrome P450 71A1-like [Prosopis alba]XP_028765143.1 cytochrome P450 71A1-like [Prosopis alba]XP_028791839.1 cytochrome P450 71A1-like [Prosopis alba]XP_028791840.1 cytochrome P450 71A1-like [Prosopis alba]